MQVTGQLSDEVYIVRAKAGRRHVWKILKQHISTVICHYIMLQSEYFEVVHDATVASPEMSEAASALGKIGDVESISLNKMADLLEESGRF